MVNSNDSTVLHVKKLPCNYHMLYLKTVEIVYKDESRNRAFDKIKSISIQRFLKKTIWFHLSPAFSQFPKNNFIQRSQNCLPYLYFFVNKLKKRLTRVTVYTFGISVRVIWCPKAIVEFHLIFVKLIKNFLSFSINQPEIANMRVKSVKVCIKINSCNEKILNFYVKN